jgi:hypothetical protein
MLLLAAALLLLAAAAAAARAHACVQCSRLPSAAPTATGTHCYSTAKHTLSHAGANTPLQDINTPACSLSRDPADARRSAAALESLSLLLPPHAAAGVYCHCVLPKLWCGDLDVPRVALSSGATNRL